MLLLLEVILSRPCRLKGLMKHYIAATIASTAVCVVLGIPLSCSHVDADPDLSREASLEILSVSPAPGAALNADSVLSFKVRYWAEAKSPSASYRLMPVFAHKDLDREGFNPGPRSHFGRLRNHWGIVEVTYPMRRAFKSEMLDEPIRVWIYLLREEGNRSTVVVKAGPVFYGGHS